MAGHHIIVTQLFHPPHESPELDPVVAVDAGIRRSALDVGIHKSLDDFFLKFIFKVQYIVGHVQGLGDKPASSTSFRVQQVFSELTPISSLS